MKLSVLVPAFNLEKYIKECLLSVLCQRVNFAYEVIVCDDASTDNTAEIIAEIAKHYPQVRFIAKPVNRGLAENMKTLLAAAEGEYIAYLDGDDVALSEKLQKQVDYLDQNSECDMVFHESDMFDSATGKSLKLYSQQHYNWPFIPTRSDITHLIRYGTYLQASSVVFRRHDNLCHTVVDDCKIILDYPFYIMNAGYLNARIDFIPEVLGRYRIHSDSFGGQTQKSTKRRLQSLADINTACKKASQFGVDNKIITQGIRHHQFAAALYFLFKNIDEQFTLLASESGRSGRFFNERHRIAWENRKRPDRARELLA